MFNGLAWWGGMDPSGGAGILRDLWVIRALAPGAPVDCACSALTWQPSGQAAALLLGPAPSWPLQLARLRGRVWKVGWLPKGGVERLVHRLGRDRTAPTLILDPVAQASAGGLKAAGLDELASLWPFCTWVTPNAQEARALGARPGQGGHPWCLPSTLVGPRWWIKSARVTDDYVEDELHLENEQWRVRSPRVRTPDPRGTGCALASALACFVAGRQGDGDGRCDAFRWDQGRWRSVAKVPRLREVLASKTWLSRARTQATLQSHGRWHLPTFPV